MGLSKEVLNVLLKYFKTLEKTGYLSFKEVKNLLVFTFLEELLDDYSHLITTEDYNNISKAIYCLYKGCLIPYSVYKKCPDVIRRDNIDYNYITESRELRSTLDQLIRIDS